MLSDIRSLVFPRSCIGCGRLGQALCFRCRALLAPHHRSDIPSLDDVVCLGKFGGWLRDAIITYKNGNRTPLLGCATAIAYGLQYVKDWNPNVQLVPIPSQKIKIQMRGFDAVSSMVTMMTREQSLVMCQLLTYQRHVGDQVGLGKSARTENVRNCFIATGPSPVHVLLVDDVATTGATLSQAAVACRKSGASKVSAITLCG